MKIQLYWLLLAALLLLSGKADAANNKKPFVIPELQEWRGAQGMFTPTATSRIVYTGKDPSVARVANQFAEDYELMFGRRMQVVQGRAAAGDHWNKFTPAIHHKTTDRIVGIITGCPFRQSLITLLFGQL